MTEGITSVRRLALFLLLLVLAAGCQSPAAPPGTAQKSAPATQVRTGVPKQYSAPPPMSVDPNKTYTATIHTTLGDMRADLFVKEAPKTANSFVFLAREGFYNNVKFHRIIKNFMVQTGDPQGNGTGGPGYRFTDEPVTRNYIRGTLAMANSGPNTNGSQFFIIHADYALSKDYTIFGQLIGKEDLETLDKIASIPVQPDARGERSIPTQDVRITGIDITEK